MKNQMPPSNPNSVSLTRDEYDIVNQNIQIELRRFQHKMVYIGCFLSFFIGASVVYALYDKTKPTVLIVWYSVLMFANFFNVFIAFKNRKILPQQTQQWDSATLQYHIVLALLCLVWGFISILYTSDNPYYQLFLLGWLQLCIVGFSFGTITDYRACIIANICIISPYITLHIMNGLFNLDNHNDGLRLSLSLIVIPSILSAFSLMACYAGYKIVNKFFRLNFENDILRNKLEYANQFLEARVKERTFELEKSLKLVTYQATHDLLTNLPNQRLLLEYIQQAISYARENKSSFAVFCLSINEIEKINDSLGHQVRNTVIKTIANRIEGYLKSPEKTKMNHAKYNIALSRKDEFFIIVEPIDDKEINSIVQRLFAILKETIHIDENKIKLTSSIGISIYPKDGTDIKSLLMNADAAMMSAKKQGGNTLNIYNSQINANAYENLLIENQLYNAIEKQEFFLNYQPFIDCKTREIVGAEALIRWENPVLGKINPEKFIPIAEANGSINLLGEWVFRTACQEILKWQKQGFTKVKIAINISAKQLQQKNIFHSIERIIKETELSTKCIELELTETEAFREDTIPVLAKLKSMGFNLSIDDFGTGYSGLSNLKLFSINKLKIDKTFVRDLATNNDSKTIVSNTIDLAKKMHVDVIAEGVETEEQYQFLMTHGCHFIQGFYFSPPVDSETFLKLLLKKNL